jgi:hypothetical protein
VALAAGGSALLFAAAGLVAWGSPLRSFLLLRFFPPEMAAEWRLAALRSMAAEAALAASVTGAVALLSALALSRRLGYRAGAVLVAGVVAADLLRAGAGLNPMVSPSFYRLSPTAERTAEDMRASGGRLFVVPAAGTGAYHRARAARGKDHEAWSFTVLRETFEPEYNLRRGVRTALSLDLTMLTPEDRVLPVRDATPSALPRLVERLRAGAVTWVLSLEPLSTPELELALENSEPALAPLVARLYRLREPRPRLELADEGRILDLEEAADRMAVEVEAMRAARLVIRDAFAPGWSVRVDGRPHMLERHEERYRAVTIEAGRHVVELRYEPPGLVLGATVTAASALLVGALILRGRSGKVGRANG